MRWSPPLSKRELISLTTLGFAGLGVAALSLVIGETPLGLTLAFLGAMTAGGASATLFLKAGVR